MGFDFSDRKSRYDWASIRLALRTFEDIHGHMNVPRKYDLPRDDPRWPEQTWGIKLGNVVSVIRIRGCYKAHHDELKEMGFVFERKWVKGQSKSRREAKLGVEKENESDNGYGRGMNEQGGDGNDENETGKNDIIRENRRTKWTTT
jgi:hypothetical protein